ncbi:MAG: hypothetical protein ACRDY7_04350 [Acidimicrobiia bacterium]
MSLQPVLMAVIFFLGAERPWHYWIAPVLALSVLGLFFMLALGYVVKVTMAKYGIKVGRRPEG